MEQRPISESHSQVSRKRILFVWDNPRVVIDRNGRRVNTTAVVWRMQEPTDNIDLNWNTLTLAQDIKDAVKCYVAHNIEAQAPKTAHQVFKQLKYCFARLPSFESAWAITYEALESAIVEARTDRKDWHFHYVRRWYQWCDDQGIPGFQGEVASRLYRLKIRCNAHGEKVMTRDVKGGPLTHDEHFQVRQAVTIGKGKLVDRVIIMLLLELGARPIQLVQLEILDFIVTISPSGQSFYSLNVPRAKQRTVGVSEKKRRRISSELGHLLQELIGQNHVKYGDQGPHMPILCIRNRSNKKLTEELQLRYALHMKVVGLTQRVRWYPGSVGIISARTGQLLSLTPRRLRYTYFTRLAEQGTSTIHLGELADHSNDRSIIIYVSSTSSVVERLNAALGKDNYFVCTMDRFLGVVIERNGNAASSATILGTTPTLKNLGGIGLCGASFLCDLYPPLSCYICPKFQAWIDGPHAELLMELEAYVKGLIAKSSNPSDRIPHQLVDVMTSIRQLLERIERLKK